MFREIYVHPDDHDLLHYIVRNEQGQFEDWCISRVTFGVTSSPFLATASLRQVAIDHAEQHFTAGLVPVKFYVDDFLHGAVNVAEALAIRVDINQLLSHGNFTLRKWRSNSEELMKAIPEELREIEPIHLTVNFNDSSPKPLGVHWNTRTDMLYVSTPTPTDQPPTKCRIAS